MLATWRSGIAAVAKCPNVYMKLGGLGMPAPVLTGIPGASPSARKSWRHRWPLADVLHRAVRPQPVYVRKQPGDKVSFSYNVMYNAFKRLSPRATRLPSVPRCSMTRRRVSTG